MDDPIIEMDDGAEMLRRRSTIVARDACARKRGEARKRHAKSACARTGGAGGLVMN
jgi:hypothetical protein